MYGDEHVEVPPEELYDKDDALGAIKNATLIYELCNKLFELRIKELNLYK